MLFNNVLLRNRRALLPYRLCTLIVSFKFSTEHHWTVLMPFFLSTDEMLFWLSPNWRKKSFVSSPLFFVSFSFWPHLRQIFSKSKLFLQSQWIELGSIDCNLLWISTSEYSWTSVIQPSVVRISLLSGHDLAVYFVYFQLKSCSRQKQSS